MTRTGARGAGGRARDEVGQLTSPGGEEECERGLGNNDGRRQGQVADGNETGGDKARRRTRANDEVGRAQE